MSFSIFSRSASSARAVHLSQYHCLLALGKKYALSIPLGLPKGQPWRGKRRVRGATNGVPPLPTDAAGADPKRPSLGSLATRGAACQRRVHGAGDESRTLEGRNLERHVHLAPRGLAKTMVLPHHDDHTRAFVLVGVHQHEIA
jgi:hypothetical protein